MVTIVEELYIEYLYSNVNNASELLEIEPGLIVLKNTRETTLFNHPHIRLWHRFLLEVFDPGLLGRECALILPCSHVKPYRISRLHSQLESMLTKYNLVDRIQRYILSEPMILVPRELDIYYPFANYDYSPKELTERDRETFVKLLASVLPKLRKHKRIVAVLPKHHTGILVSALKSCSMCIEIEVYNYGRRAFKTIKYVVEKVGTACIAPSNNN